MKRKLGCILKTISFCGYVMADENVYCIFHYIVMEVWFEKYLYFLFNMFAAMYVKCIQLSNSSNLSEDLTTNNRVDQNLNISSNLKLLMPDILPGIVWMVGF